jgi:hypothetical protein
MPPSLNLPTPARDLAAARTGDTVHLTWTVSTHTTDHLAIKRLVPVELCRQVDNGPCGAVAALSLKAGAHGEYDDALPPELGRPPLRLLTYRVSLTNRRGKSAGPSGPAFTAAGGAPAQVAGLTARTLARGVLLSWHPESGATAITSLRIHRTLLTPRPKPGPKPAAGEKSPLSPSAPPAAATLQIDAPGGADPGRALDPTAELGQRYRYTVERVADLKIAGQSVEIRGKLSDPVFIETTDIFPPAVPQGLEAVADSAGDSIDLSWLPGSEADLAGYYVYRRETSSAAPPVRISPAGAPAPASAFDDSQAQRGRTYAYSVSAVDRSGNESARSSEVVQTLPDR